MNFPGVIQRVVHIGGGQIKRQCVDCPGQFPLRQAHLASRFFEGIRQDHLARGISMSNSKSRGSTSALKRTVNFRHDPVQRKHGGSWQRNSSPHPSTCRKITPPFQARTCPRSWAIGRVSFLPSFCGFPSTRISLGFSFDSYSSKKTSDSSNTHSPRLEKISFPCPSYARLLADALACMGIRRKALLQPGRPPHSFRKLLLLSWGRREQARFWPKADLRLGVMGSSGCSPE